MSDVNKSEVPESLSKEALEVLAFQLSRIITAPEEELRALTAEAVSMDSWRRCVDLTAYRQLARLFVMALDESGLRMVCSSKKRLTDKLEEIMTIPARKAYTL